MVDAADIVGKKISRGWSAVTQESIFCVGTNQRKGEKRRVDGGEDILLLVIVVFTQPLAQLLQEKKSKVRAHEQRVSRAGKCRIAGPRRRWPPAALT